MGHNKREEHYATYQRPAFPKSNKVNPITSSFRYGLKERGISLSGATAPESPSFDFAGASVDDERLQIAPQLSLAPFFQARIILSYQTTFEKKK